MKQFYSGYNFHWASLQSVLGKLYVLCQL